MGQYKRDNWLRVIVGAVLGGAFLFFSFRAADDLFDISKNLDILTSIYREINLNYVDEVKAGEVMQKGIEGMLSTLDPYTEFIPESDIDEFKMNYVSTEYGGIGALIMSRDEGVYISEIYEGFPAWKNGLRAGDEIVEIDGIPVRGKAPEKVSELLKGPGNTTLKLVARRPGQDRLIEKQIKRGEIHFDNVSYYGTVGEKTGYIKLDKFLEDAAEEVADAFLELKKKDQISSLILDLRGNGGGILQEAVKIVGFFIESGDTVVIQKGKGARNVITYRATGKSLDRNIPLAVLVDRNTASASEIVAGAFQDFDRAVVVGQRTFGKGLVQQTLRMPYNTLLKMTIAKYYTPSGRCIQALDYAHRALDGSAVRIADSLISEFYTHNGRRVYDGSGIYPDIATEPVRHSHVTYSILNNLYHFDYATEFRSRHQQIPPVASFAINDEIYGDFISWLDTKDFDYQTSSEQLMDRLKEVTAKEKRFADLEPEYDALLEKLRHNKSEDLVTFKDEITRLLENEIVSRYYFQEGRILSSLKYDQDVEKALEVLDNRQLYASILQGQGNYKTIGKPVSVLARANPESQEPVVREEADETVVPGPQPVPVVPFEEGN
ncbi:MAG: S41 family peptidase [Solitalea sp.]